MGRRSSKNGQVVLILAVGLAVGALGRALLKAASYVAAAPYSGPAIVPAASEPSPPPPTLAAQRRPEMGELIIGEPSEAAASAHEGVARKLVIRRGLAEAVERFEPAEQASELDTLTPSGRPGASPPPFSAAPAAGSAGAGQRGVSESGDGSPADNAVPARRHFDAPLPARRSGSATRLTRSAASYLRKAINANTPKSDWPGQKELAAAFEKDAKAYAASLSAGAAVPPFISANPALSQAISGTGLVLPGGPNAFGTIAGGAGGGAGGSAGGSPGASANLGGGRQPQASEPLGADQVAGPSPIPWKAQPNDTGMMFPDISHWNTVKDWDALAKASKGIIVMKVRQVSVDPMFNPRLKEAEERKMIVIGYAFGYGGISGATQADALLHHFPPKPGRILMLDLERNPPQYGKTMSAAEASAFVERIRQRTGQYPLLYTSASWSRPGVLAKCPRYIAQWGSTPSSAEIWQFTNGVVGPPPHTFPGIGHCDINKLRVTYLKLRRWAGLDNNVASAR